MCKVVLGSYLSYFHLEDQVKVSTISYIKILLLQLFSDLLVDPSMGLEFNLVPGDLVAFNNRRVLHARSGFNAAKVDR